MGWIGGDLSHEQDELQEHDGPEPRTRSDHRRGPATRSAARVVIPASVERGPSTLPGALAGAATGAVRVVTDKVKLPVFTGARRTLGRAS